MRTISIKTIPHKEMRYTTCGDWLEEDGKSVVKVSDMGNEDYEFVVAIHEVVEQYLCRKRGIEDFAVTEFDKQHLDHENPGDLIDAPYHKEHAVATVVEMLLISELNIDLEKYEKTMMGLFDWEI